jgi:hypothetical protein
MAAKAGNDPVEGPEIRGLIGRAYKQLYVKEVCQLEATPLGRTLLPVLAYALLQKEGENSGSPVFNRQLKPFAIHHRALEDMKLNEGILLNEIRAALAR